MNTPNIKSTVYRVLQSTLVVGLIAFIAISCNDINSNDTNTEKAQMNVSLIDAPGDYQEVNIDVQGLRIQYTPSSNDTASADGQWIDLPVEPMKINLLELTNGVDTLLAEAELNPGHYEELRLILGEDNTVMVDSTIQNLKVPSGQQSGYKIKFKTDLEAGDELDVVVDFDAGRSVHKAGNSGKYILKPVLKAFVESGDEVDVGSVAGVVDPSEAAPNVYVLMGEDTTATTQTDEDGSFLLQGLENGQYDISIEPTTEQYADTTVNDVMVEEDEQTDLGTIILNETE
ncbi:hypothetical protein CK503_05500 [Aliifodinibius salipaludis]|uniref:DUF4382 domain-containing protein n=1 Tax=Fodinibius salipaludis TaxID=2032627 RepID=A0A2A2GDJ8_9BACT|nr:DUF4382 domain-containing protein [Aliifodinibius salipaludis]PAU94925.1 hypothetical protein CK503_05500 [Aliifodinibius salipaludis]